MDLIRQNRLLTWTVGLLVLLNLGVLGTLWWKQLRPPPIMPQDEPIPLPDRGLGDPGRNPDVVGFLARELRFDDEQIRQFRQLRSRFFEEEFRLRQDIHDLKQTLTKAVFDANTDPSRVNDLAAKIGKKHLNMELIQFEHLQAIKALCTPDQRERFMALMDDVLRLSRPQGRGPRRGPGRGFGPGRPMWDRPLRDGQDGPPEGQPPPL